MKYPTAGHIGGCTLVILVLLAVIFGCSTLPTAQPVKDLRSIRGKWEGWGSNIKFGRFFVTFVIRESGDWQMKTDIPIYRASQFSGKAWVAEGKFEVYTETPEMRGTYTLHGKDEKRWLVFRSDDGDTTWELVPSFR